MNTTTIQRIATTHQTADRMAVFEDLVRTYEKPLFQFAFRLSGNHHEAQDLLQESLYRAYKSFAKFEEGTAFDRWLYQIIHNLYIDHYRKKKNRPVVASIDEPLPHLENEKTIEIPDWTANPEEEAMRGELGRQIQRGLNELPSEYRSAVILCDIQGLSYEEIAQILGISIGTVRSRIHRGRKILRRILLPYLRGMEVEH
ncbi:RNA polymerase sigma-70 factor (ECF subfamily) [Hydrogenispora ethanolica]|uniref:RNA polymerase sigma-70 factor (ECF subfamily) n=1 Tax=Hydrogenispora ethanolica TaxID=1082276 RepID=A0A4R1RB64_HYDET|nr:sigma-70 family RNA polymerase sigma factor [Hydrogenispora ethanolica]TCL62976.1 RNA polymerase sigma-70 factor (ECF subfamily) [Hydrogenispora ethanolica]